MNSIIQRIYRGIACGIIMLVAVPCMNMCIAQMPSEDEALYVDAVNRNRMLVIYYSRTGKTQVIAESIAHAIGADIIRITEPERDRTGWQGFAEAAFDAFFDRRSDINPRKINLEPYNTVIIATPIWSWNLATPIHTLLQTNYFGTQRLILVTTANIDIKKYDRFKDGSGNAVQNFLHSYLDQKRMKARRQISAATANELEQFKGHFHLETKGKSNEQLGDEAGAVAAAIAAMLNLPAEAAGD